MYKASHIANYFLEKGSSEQIAITPMMLIKLVYMAEGWSLAMLEKDLLGSEEVEAWQHGPVIPSLYHEFKRFGSSPITDLAYEVDIDTYLEDPSHTQTFTPKVDLTDEQLVVTLDLVWDSYKHRSGGALRNLTHKPGTPWSDVYNPDRRNTIIPKGEITEYYNQFIKDLISKSKGME